MIQEPATDAPRAYVPSRLAVKSSQPLLCRHPPAAPCGRLILGTKVRIFPRTAKLAPRFFVKRTPKNAKNSRMMLLF